ncbi:MAG: hypothetical protein O3A46_02310 [Candidatus Poribacteria bacterium]|nr:hypothetical protein [Candidatus Poribacteria bacterium]
MSEKLYELETIIRFDEDGGTATLYTASRRVAAKLHNAGLMPIKTYRNGTTITGWLFELPPYDVIVKPERRAIRLGVKKRS